MKYVVILLVLIFTVAEEEEGFFQRIANNLKYLLTSDHVPENQGVEMPIKYINGFIDGVMTNIKIPNITTCYNYAHDIAHSIYTLTTSVRQEHMDMSALYLTSYQSYKFYSECYKGNPIQILYSATPSMEILTISKTLLYHWSEIKAAFENINSNKTNIYAVGKLCSELLTGILIN